MARFFYVIKKNADNNLFQVLKSNISLLEKKAIPSIIEPNEYEILETKKSLGVIFNPVKSEKIIDNNICVGVMFPEITDWYKVGAPEPIGNYAIVRIDKDNVEVLVDYQATITVWYYFDENIFIASSSQRAIISILGTFQIDKNTISWMLSSGTLGPENSWDCRIKAMKPSSSITLNRNKWWITLKTKSIQFRPNKNNNKLVLNNFFSSIYSVIKEFPDKLRYVHLLTGGYDSRLIFYYCLENNIRISKYITFGLKESENIKLSDADIAKRLAKKYSLDWEYLHTNYKETNHESFFDLFIAISEGRLDNVERFTDGLNIWKHLFEQNYNTTIVGADGFRNQIHYRNDKFIRLQKRLILVKDIENIPLKYQQMFYQIFPSYLIKNEEESFEQYYHRISQEFFGPYADAALNFPKTAFLNLVYPLVTKPVLDSMRQIPDKYRKNKRIVKTFVKKKDKSIPFSIHHSVQSTIKFITSNNILNYIIDFVNKEKSKQYIIPHEFIDFVLGEITSTSLNSTNKKYLIRNLIPINMRTTLHQLCTELNIRKNFNATIEQEILLFRIFIILKTNKMLLDDAMSLIK